MTTITKGNLFKQIAVIIDAFVIPLNIPLAVYFVFFTGGYQGDEILHLVMGVVIAVIVTTPIVLFYQYRKIFVILDNLKDNAYDKRALKINMLHLPWHSGLIGLARWIIGASITIIYCNIRFDLTAMHVIPIVLIAPLLGIINIIMSYYNTENRLVPLLSQDEIRDTWLKDEEFKGLSFTMRILMLVVPVVAIPTIVFGYMLYLFSIDKFSMNNIGLHIGFILFLSAVTIALVMYFMMTNIKQTINTLKKALDDVKDGRLDIPGVPMITTSEIGMISQSANALIVKLREVIQKVKDSSGQVNASSSSISEVAQALASSANEQASNFEEISASLEEIGSGITSNTTRAAETDGLARKTAEESKDVGESVMNTISSMKSISNKIKSIEEIASQTNMLALNAAIEAARAGDSGKGFSVVAAEVRRLAEDSRKLSGEISELVLTSSEVVDKADSLIKNILPKIQKTADLINEISSSSQEQDRGVEQINAGMSQLNETTQSNASSAEELSATSENLKANSDELQRAVEYFKI